MPDSSAAAYKVMLGLWGSPLYVFDESTLRSRINSFRVAFELRFPHLEIAYPYKANDLAAVCALTASLGLSAEVSSPEQLELARRLGVPGTSTIYNSPWKTSDSLKSAVQRGVRIHSDSLVELRSIDAIAQEVGTNAKVGLRLSTAAIKPHWSRFGLVPESVEFSDAVECIASSDRLELVSVQAHVGTQVRSVESFRRAAELVATVVADLEAGHNLEIEQLDLGGGFAAGSTRGLLEEQSDTPSADQYADAIAEGLGDLGASRTVVVEPGRLLVAESGTMLCTVRDLRHHNGRQIAVLDAGTNSVPTLSVEAHPIRPIKTLLSATQVVESELYGPLCTQHDVVALGVDLPPLSVGDTLLIEEVGAYAIALSNQFIFGRPAVVIARSGGKTELLRPRDDTHDRWEHDLIPKGMS